MAPATWWIEVRLVVHHLSSHEDSSQSSGLLLVDEPNLSGSFNVNVMTQSHAAKERILLN